MSANVHKLHTNHTPLVFVFLRKDDLLQTRLSSLFQHPTLLPITGPHQSHFSSWNHSVKLKTKRRTTTTLLPVLLLMLAAYTLTHI